MTLHQFITKYDQKGAVVLLEGKRKVAENDQPKLIELGNLLASKIRYLIFRSGNAAGADEYFSIGVNQVAPERMQVIVPYTGHRKKENKAYKTHSLEEINLAEEPDIVYQSKMNRNTKNLVDKYVDGQKNRYTIKAAYIIRDTVKVIGTTEIPPANFAIFYDDLTNPGTGGTGHTMNICEHNDVDYITQETWFGWLNK
jgi:hypothetical protein